MRGKKFISLLLTLTIASSCFSLICAISMSQTANITLKINGIQEVKGDMSVALYNNADDFPGRENYIVGKDIPIKSKAFEYVFNDIPFGTYAIAIYHDLDKNGELNKNWIGIPKEPYGFSNDATGRMGPPDYEDATFEVEKDMEIIITLID